MNLIKFLLLASLSITSFCTQAALISASHFAIGTEISQFDDNTSISWIRSKRHDATETLPVSIQVSDPNGHVKHFATSTGFGGGSHSLVTHVEQNGGGLRLESLVDVYAREDFGAMLISYVAPTRQLTVTGFDNSGDGFAALTFDREGKFLERVNAPGKGHRTEICSGECRHMYAFGGTLRFNSEAYYILLGGQDTAAFLQAIDVSLPEPSPLPLLALAGIGLALYNRRRNRKELLNT